MFLIWHVGLLINLVTKDKAKSSIKYMIKIIGYDSQKQIKFLEELIKQDLGISKYSPVKSIKEDNNDIIYYKM